MAAETITLTYIGKRFFKDALHDRFQCAVGNEYNFSIKPRDKRSHLIIGHDYEIEVTDGENYKIGNARSTGMMASGKEIQEWSMLNRASMDDRQTFRLTAKYRKENEDAWLLAMSPITRAYSRSTPNQRRAIKLRVLEILERT